MDQAGNVCSDRWHGTSEYVFSLKNDHYLGTETNQIEEYSLARPKRILLVDDELTVRESLERLLCLEGYLVVAVATCQEAIEALSKWQFDLAISDLNLGGESGWDVCARLSATSPGVPFIVITARPDQVRLADMAGAAFLVNKPLIDLPQLLRTIATLVAE